MSSHCQQCNESADAVSITHHAIVCFEVVIENRDETVDTREKFSYLLLSSSLVLLSARYVILAMKNKMTCYYVRGYKDHIISGMTHWSGH